MAFCPHCPHGWWQFILTEYPSFLHMATTATLDSSPWESSTSQNITVQKTLAGEVPFIRHPHLPLLFTVWLHHLVFGAPAFILPFSGEHLPLLALPLINHCLIL